VVAVIGRAVARSRHGEGRCRCWCGRC